MESLAPQKILIVEDDPDIAQIARLILQEEGFVVTLAEDAAQGLECIEASPPDLIIADVMMHAMDGLQFLAVVKNDEATASIPVLMMSALVGDGDARRGRDAGAEYYLKKPFPRAQLVAAVKAVFAVAQKKQKLRESES
jgi:DNA-binding response OmpR family regulator